jgi:putative ABC transport system permease protein
MKTIRLARHSLRMMSRYKLRTGFMMLGSLIGIAALTFVISAGQAAERKTLQTVSQMVGDAGLVIQASGGEVGGPRATAARLKIEDIAAVAREVPGIETWDPKQQLATSIRRGGSTDTANVLGESERWPQVWHRTASRGDTFDEAAVSSSARVAVIGQTVAQQLFGNDDPIGADIQIGSVPFKVIGVLESWGTDPHGMDRDNEIIVPISTLMRRLSNVDTISEAKLVVRDPSHVEELRPQIRKFLRDRHGISAGQPNGFTIITPAVTRVWVSQIRQIMFFYLPLVAAIVLLVGAIVSATLMLASVNGRVSEIGLRRAIGARSEDIRLQFLLETVLTIVVGGLGGIALGYVIALIEANRLHLGNVSPFMAALLGIVTSSIVGVIAGVLPALRAARLQPAEALR